MHRLLWLVVASSVFACALVVRAQDLSSLAAMAEPGAEGSPEELAAWHLVLQRKLVEAREAASKVVAAHPDSYIGHFVLGYVQHYAEGNFPKALYHHKKALSLFEQRHGPPPGPEAPWQWHARILLELAATHGDLEHYVERLRFIERHNTLYDPDMMAEQAWPLMKLGRYEDARRAAAKGLVSEDPRQVEIALNALCAIEFEAGHDGKSYDACKRALDHNRESGFVNAVDLTNFAEASRSLFKLDEAERILLEATRADVAWYGNPWMELADLYVRQGRFAEALGALREIPAYRSKRPPHVRDADRNETRRSIAAFFLAVGRADDAVRITDEALVMPDRRSHNSRDPAQDRAIISLVDRRARRLAAERVLERAAAEPLQERVWAGFQALWLRFEGWMSGRQAARLLADDARLVGTFRVGTAESAVMPPWLTGELARVVGPAVVREALARARARERRPGAAAYYDAFEAEAALGEGNEERAVALAARALEGLGPAEVLLRARTEAVAAEAERRLGRYDRAARHYDRAFQKDPGVLRRLELELPIRVTVRGDRVADEVADAIERSPRFDVGDIGLALQVDANAGGGRVCLIGAGGTSLGCGEARPESGDGAAELAARIVASLHETLLAPRVDLTQADANSLDGSNRVGRDPLETLFHEPEPFGLEEPGLDGDDAPAADEDDP